MPNIWQTPISSIPESKPDCYLGWGGGRRGRQRLHRAGQARRVEEQAQATLPDRRETLEAKADQEQARIEVGQAMGAQQGQPAREGGTPVPGDQASVRLRQGALWRLGEECRASADAVCAVEPVAEAKAVDACRREGVPVIGAIPRECAGNREKIEGLSAVSATDAAYLVVRLR